MSASIAPVDTSVLFSWNRLLKYLMTRVVMTCYYREGVWIGDEGSGVIGCSTAIVGIDNSLQAQDVGNNVINLSRVGIDER